MKGKDEDSPDEMEMLRLPRVVRRVGLCKGAIYKLEAQGLFPKRVKLTSRASAWLASEIDGWLKRRVELSRGGSDA